MGKLKSRFPFSVLLPSTYFVCMLARCLYCCPSLLEVQILTLISYVFSVIGIQLFEHIVT
jgi:hypothetical protein